MKSQLPTLSELIDSAREHTLPHYWKLMGIALVGALLLAPFNLYLLYNPDFLVPTFTQESLGTFFIVLFGTLFVSMFIQFWTRLALNLSVIQPKKIRIFQSYKAALKLLPTFLWVYFLILLIVVPGFLLFLIPGLIVLMNTYFSAWFVSTGEARGLTAMAKSRELFRGVFWEAAGKVFFPFLLVMTISMAVNYGLPFKPIWNDEVTTVIITIFNLFFYVLVTPFVVQYDYELFLALKKRAPKKAPEKQIKKYKVLSIIGGTLFTLYVLLVVLVLSLSSLFPQAQNTPQAPERPSTVIQP